MKGLQEFISEYEAAFPDLVIHVDKEVDARWEASAIALKAQKELREPPVLIFNRIRTTAGTLSKFPVVLNLFASRQRAAYAVGSDFQQIGRDLFQRREQRIKPVVVDQGLP